MDKERIIAAAGLLGMKPEELVNALDMGGEEGCGEVNPEGFYFNPDVFRKLHSIDSKGLRDLVVPNIKRLRR